MFTFFDLIIVWVVGVFVASVAWWIWGLKWRVKLKKEIDEIKQKIDRK